MIVIASNKAMADDVNYHFYHKEYVEHILHQYPDHSIFEAFDHSELNYD